MFIKTQDENTIINLERFEGVVISNSEIQLVCLEDKTTRTIGKFEDEQSAKIAFFDICNALRDGKNFFEMPAETEESNEMQKIIKEIKLELKGREIHAIRMNDMENADIKHLQIYTSQDDTECFNFYVTKNLLEDGLIDKLVKGN